LAVHGSVNDVAVSGAMPRFMTLGVFLEEGLEIVGRGECDGIYLAATGIGLCARDACFALDCVRAGDRILVSGPIGDHGAAVMLARQEFGLRGDLKSDAASVLPQAQALMTVAGLRFMRDPTRGGLATVAHELARAARLTVRLSEAHIPLDTALGGQRSLDDLEDDPLPRIC
jgi:hydrogenase expression/formation protein HypE